MFSALFFAIAVNIITRYQRKDLKNKTLYEDDLVSMSKSIENLRVVFEIGRGD